ncbi:hypothetical protein [uncultured Aquimarina sp.]|uniref:hypothetical protein n=1 Tax=uncultured Aquimarina sp. TaxID=575652 RepID=UPI00260687DD|nr:hypothetical protein [uncultured Aquimarina sp.]
MKTFLIVFWLIVLTACNKQAEKPFVQAVYPTSKVLPENLLRIYIQFSQPMKTTGNIEKIKLIDNHDNEVKNVFFNNATELWNKEQTQLTLILDPARVKTGLKANGTLGYAIKPNQNYTLIIEDLEDVYHQKMTTSFKKNITVENADTRIPEPKNWKLNIPEVNSNKSFIVHFSQILDYNSLRQRLIITDTKNNPIEGSVSIKNQETQWSFQPKEYWESGDYILHINKRLEDPSGNNLNGLFDHKVGSLKYSREGVLEKIPFTIKP